MAERSKDHTQTVLWSWEVVYDACYAVARDIKTFEGEGRKFREIIAVSRGGLIPATILSHLLSIPITGTIFNPRALMTDSMGLINAQCIRDDLIIVDDICDTGNTFQDIKGVYPNALRVCLCAKVAGRGNYESSSLEYNDNQWLQFPWELDPLS